MNSKGSRPPIPEPTKRAVRQRFLFGCAVCGSPVFDYDHIQQFSEVNEHELDNLILLCPNHHSAKTRNRLSTARILHYKENFHNRGKVFTSAYDLDKSESIFILVGTSTLYWNPPELDGDCHVIWISGQDQFVLHRRDGWLTFSMTLTDDQGNILLDINHGEMRASSDVWDYEYVGSRLTIRKGLGQIILDMDIANDRVLLHKACFISGNMGWKIDKGFIRAIGTKGNILAFGSTAKISGDKVGMFGLINIAAFRQLHCPRFIWMLEQDIEPKFYIWLSEESLQRFKQGELTLSSLEQKWREQIELFDFNEELQNKCRGHYYLDLTTNERYRPPDDRIRLSLKEITKFFSQIVSSIPRTSTIHFRAEPVAYVPFELLNEYRETSDGVFVEPDLEAANRATRLVVHVEGHTESRLIVQTGVEIDFLTS